MMLENSSNNQVYFDHHDQAAFEAIEKLARSDDEPQQQFDQQLAATLTGQTESQQPEAIVSSEALASGIDALPNQRQAPGRLQDQTAPIESQTGSDNKSKSKTTNSTTPIEFTDLQLSAEVQKAVKLAGYQNPTPIQAEIIPHVLAGRDVLAQSQTGTGKTAAFALPILSRVETEDRTPQVLVLTPTRELAIQVSDSFASYGSCMPNLGVISIYGGQDYEIQFRKLRRGVQVVVGTPGRVIDHVKRGTLDLSEIECLVLDEADEMLNMGFLEDVEFVLKQTPRDRQIALFSATLPQPIRKISKRYLNDPAKVTIQRKTMTADSIRQRAVFVAPRDRVELLTRFLEAENADGSIVFTRTRETTTIVADKLAKAGLSAAALSGDMPQNARERTIERLKSGNLDILVATDIAARGLDISRISHIFNYDLPEGGESYVHRIGRTGRAGRTGEAIIFLTRKQKNKLRLIENVTRQPIEIVEPPTTKQINNMRVQRFKQRIAQTIQETDLTFFEKMLTDFAADSEQSFEKIAAAVAHIGQQGRHFLMKDRPIGERAGKNRDRHDNRTSDRRARFHEPPAEGLVRYRISVGKRDGARPGNIVGAVANEAGIDGKCIGPILIHESYSTIDLPENMPEHICDTLQNTRVAGRKLKLCLATDQDSQPRNSLNNNAFQDQSDRFQSRKRKRRSTKSFAGKAGRKFKNKKSRRGK